MQTVPSELFYQQVGINEKLCHKLEIEHARVEQYAEAYDHLKIQFAKLQRQHFGSKSERYIEDQLPLLIERYFVCKNQLQYLEKPLKF